MSDALDWLIAARPGPMQAYFAFLKQAGGALDPKTRALISVITKVGAQTERGFRQYLERALRVGCTADEVLDALLMAFPILGFTKIVWAVDQIIVLRLPEFDLERLTGLASADAQPASGNADSHGDGEVAGHHPAPVAATGANPLAGDAASPEGVWTVLGALEDFSAAGLLHLPGPGGGCFVRRAGEVFHVFRANCPHRATPLSLADVDEAADCIRCPRHDWCFDTRTGAALGVSAAPLQVLPWRLVDGHLEVRWD